MIRSRWRSNTTRTVGRGGSSAPLTRNNSGSPSTAPSTSRAVDSLSITPPGGATDSIRWAMPTCSPIAVYPNGVWQPSYPYGGSRSAWRMAMYLPGRLYLAPLSSGNSWRVGFVGEHGSVDDVGEPAFEDAKGFHAAVATVGAPLEQFTSCWVTPGLSQGDAV